MASAVNLCMTIDVEPGVVELWRGVLRILAIFIPLEEMVTAGNSGENQLSGGICTPCNKDECRTRQGRTVPPRMANNARRDRINRTGGNHKRRGQRATSAERMCAEE